jgi:hypothetical protein
MPFSLSPDEALALAGRIPGVCAAHDRAQPTGRGLLWKLAAWPFLDRFGFYRRNRPSYTLLQF